MNKLPLNIIRICALSLVCAAPIAPSQASPNIEGTEDGTAYQEQNLDTSADDQLHDEQADERANEEFAEDELSVGESEQSTDYD